MPKTAQASLSALWPTGRPLPKRYARCWITVDRNSSRFTIDVTKYDADKRDVKNPRSLFRLYAAFGRGG
jgi:hypothetical protein